MLCEHGQIQSFEPGPIHVEGDPATCFYVLLDGELVMSKRSGGVDIRTKNRTSQRGVYCGAWSAYIPGEEQVYQASVRVTTPARFFVLDAGAFATFAENAVSDGGPSTRGPHGRRPAAESNHRSTREAVGAGNDNGWPHPPAEQPGRGHRRAVADLHENGGKMRHKLAMLADGKFSPEALRALVTIQDQVSEQVAKSKNQELTALETADREDEVGEWLEDHGITNAWDFASTFVEPVWTPALAGTDLGDSRRRHHPLVESATECHRLDEVHHRRRADDEPDR